jgi:hypothetical protein
VFGRKPPKKEDDRSDVHSDLVEMLLDADDVERKRLLLMALQTGELKMSEAPELLRLVERLAGVAGHEGREPASY